MATSISLKSQPTWPLLRWAGGKRFLLPTIIAHLPDDFHARRYFEPFLGSGSLFFFSRPTHAVIADANPDLISTYRYVKSSPETIARYLRTHRARDSKKHYYRIRNCYNCSRPSAAQAARFIYLNRTCFNGIFRVNQAGEFNVPYGYKENPVIPTLKHLRAASSQLRTATIRHSGYQQTLQLAKAGDFIYLDPPYPPLNGTSYFTHYTPDRFTVADQATLALSIHELSKRGCLIMMSNADSPLIRRLYTAFRQIRIDVTRYVTCKSRKHKVRELIVCNY